MSSCHKGVCQSTSDRQNTNYVSSLSESPCLHVVLVVAAVCVDAATVFLDGHDNAMGAESLCVVVAPEGVTGGDTEVVTASTLEAVLGLNLRLLFVVGLGNFLGIEVPIIVVVPVNCLNLGVPDTEIVEIEVIPVEVPFLNGRVGRK